MSFQTRPDERFAPVFGKSDYQSTDPVVKANYVPKGSNLIFGRNAREEELSSLIYIGKVIENTVGRNYLNADCWLDIRFPHVIYITGTRGSGKSFDLGVLLEGISALTRSSPVQHNVLPIPSILVDTQSQFWTLGYEPNPAVPENKAQLSDLDRWNIRPNSLRNVRLFVAPCSERFTGQEHVFSIKPNQIRHEEWCALLQEEVYSPQGHILAKTIESMGKPDYSLADMMKYIGADLNWPNEAVSSRNALLYKLEDYRRTRLFEGEGLDVGSLLQEGQCSVFMLRDLRNEDKSLVTSLIARQLFSVMGEYHKKLKVGRFFQKKMLHRSLPNRVWLLVDEAHVIAPAGIPSPARAALIEYVKRGRDAGLSLALATQQPSAVDDRILSQVNLTFSHRLSFQQDIIAASNRIPTKTLASLKYAGIEVHDFGDMLRYLDAGQCFVGDHNTSRTVLVQVRPRITSHGGYSPN
jgi:uncharacterized protein